MTFEVAFAIMILYSCRGPARGKEHENVGKIIAFANQKGGIGKTTSAINIAASIAATGKKTLLVDCDPQGNSSSGLGINKKSLKLSTYDLLVGRADAEGAVCATAFENLSVIPTNISLAGAEFELIQLDDRAFRMKNSLEKLKETFDYIFIDCPPSLGILSKTPWLACWSEGAFEAAP